VLEIAPKNVNNAGANLLVAIADLPIIKLPTAQSLPILTMLNAVGAMRPATLQRIVPMLQSSQRHAVSAVPKTIYRATVTKSRTWISSLATTAMRLVITLAIAPSLGTGLVSSAATVARWDTPSVVVPSLLQRKRLAQLRLGVKLEVKPGGVQQALFQMKLVDGAMVMRLQLHLPGKVVQSVQLCKCVSNIIAYQPTLKCSKGAGHFFLFAFIFFMSIIFQDKVS
jgi:hypothetical protein